MGRASMLHARAVALLLGVAAPAAIAVDIGATETATSRPTPRTLTHTTPTSASDEELAQLWSLSVPEIRRARVLMQGPRGAFSSSQLSPIEALGIHARSDAERERYARLFARVSYDDTLRVLAWARAAQAHAERVTAGHPVLNFDGAPRARVSHEAADMLGVPRSAVVPPPTPSREIEAKPPAAKATGRAVDNAANSTKRQRGQ